MARAPRGHVLILDDDPNVCEFFSRVLADIGVRFTVCHGINGLDLMEPSGIRLNLIVTNLVPLNVGPAALLAELSSRFPDVPVLHLQEVTPFSVENFEAMARQRMRKSDRGA